MYYNKLKDNINNYNLLNLLDYLFKAFEEISNNLYNDSYNSEKIGTDNVFGDFQLDVDLNTNEIIFNALKNSKLVHIGSSEETPQEISLCSNDSHIKGFSVAFDPLDGSSIVDCNFAVGTICGIWEGKRLLGQKYKDMICSIMVIYGPKTSLVLAFNKNITKNGKDICMKLNLKDKNWYILEDSIEIEKKGKIFAPGNLAAISENKNYKKVFDYWIDNKYKLRYTGGLVPDIYHILIKKKGIFTNFSSISYKAKLRLLYEVYPILLIINASGGASYICNNNDIYDEIKDDKIIDDLKEKVNVCYGSKDEVKQFVDIYNLKDDHTLKII